MQTNLADFIKDTPEGKEADAILRACVHCGFCTATCPTYQILGDELDGPRGRIYLMKKMLEGEPVTEKTQIHLDRCLTCRSCETTCPSGVRYGRLVDIGRNVMEQRVGRSPAERAKRRALRLVLPRPRVFNSLLKMGQLVRPVLPAALKRKVPKAGPAPYWPAARHERKMLVLDGCVQPGLAPNINAAAARVFDALKISLVRAQEAGCCGALSYHLNAQAEGLDYMRQNIDAWSPHIEQGTQAVVMTASGCGVMVKEYGHLLAHDLSYAGRAERVSALTGDLSEILHAERDALKLALERAAKGRPATKLAFHSPCTLQHGQQIRGFAEELLRLAGFELTYVPDAHLCCGSAGTYSILQPELSQQLLRNKVTALQSGGPQLIATANIGCLTHLESGTQIPVKHWIEVLDERLASAAA